MASWQDFEEAQLRSTGWTAQYTWYNRSKVLILSPTTTAQNNNREVGPRSADFSYTSQEEAPLKPYILLTQLLAHRTGEIWPATLLTLSSSDCIESIRKASFLYQWVEKRHFCTARRCCSPSPLLAALLFTLSLPAVPTLPPGAAQFPCACSKAFSLLLGRTRTKALLEELSAPPYTPHLLDQRAW